MKPVLIIHGGAGSRRPTAEIAKVRAASLHRILAGVYPKLRRGCSALEAAIFAVELLENDPLYNAGRGSKIQRDGVIRMSASLMDGHARRFAGCVNVERVKNPIRLAELLMEEEYRVLAGEGATKYARKARLPFRSPYTAAQLGDFKKKRAGRSGTVGAVVLDSRGRLAAATSTGGRGYEFPGRVSDSATVAANFANGSCALSATGNGEEIVEFGVAAAICALVESGQSLPSAARKMLNAARKKHAEFGLIALDASGQSFANTTTAHLVWAKMSAAGEKLNS